MLLLTHIEMMKSTQSLRTFSEEHREDKNKGKLEDSFVKGSQLGQFPTKPCINPCNLPYNDNAKVFTYESFIAMRGSKRKREGIANSFSKWVYKKKRKHRKLTPTQYPYEYIHYYSTH